MTQRIQFNLPFSYYRNENGILAFDIEDQFSIGPEEEPVTICGCRISISTKQLTVSNSAWLSDGGVTAFISCCERQLRGTLSKSRHKPAKLSPLENSFIIQLKRTSQDWGLKYLFSDGLSDGAAAGDNSGQGDLRAGHRLSAELKGLWVKEADVVGLLKFLRMPLEVPRVGRY